MEDVLKELRNEVSNNRQSTDRAIQEIRDKLGGESLVRQTSDEQLKGLIESQAVEGVHWEVVGLVWLFFGILFAGIPQADITALLSTFLGSCAPA
ncbi:MAG: hypothetical protein L0Y38_02930 [Methylococcaceae bacterium]|nr:hypothetical protein [Methylococcaceae bacterium]MCI0732761.1 hypothetical protein [Methylococcaceae bacterium]